MYYRRLHDRQTKARHKTTPPRMTKRQEDTITTVVSIYLFWHKYGRACFFLHLFLEAGVRPRPQGIDHPVSLVPPFLAFFFFFFVANASGSASRGCTLLEGRPPGSRKYTLHHDDGRHHVPAPDHIIFAAKSNETAARTARACSKQQSCRVALVRRP